MSEDQRRKLTVLRRCRMYPGTWDKRFVRDLASAPEDYELSGPQAEQLDRLWHRYRRQVRILTGEVVRE